MFQIEKEETLLKIFSITFVESGPLLKKIFCHVKNLTFSFARTFCDPFFVKVNSWVEQNIEGKFFNYGDFFSAEDLSDEWTEKKQEGRGGAEAFGRVT